MARFFVTHAPRRVPTCNRVYNMKLVIYSKGAVHRYIDTCTYTKCLKSASRRVPNSAASTIYILLSRCSFTALNTISHICHARPLSHKSKTRPLDKWPISYQQVRKKVKPSSLLRVNPLRPADAAVTDGEECPGETADDGACVGAERPTNR